MQICKKERVLTRDKALQILCVFPIVRAILKLILESLVGSVFSNCIIYGMIALLFVWVFPIIRKIIGVNDIIFFCLWTIILLVHIFFLEKEKVTYMNLVIVAIIKCYPMYFIGKAIGREIKNIKNILPVCTIVVVLAYLFLNIITKNNMYGEENYSQALGYALVMATCVAIYFSLEGKVYQVPVVVILLYGILISGTRGALLSVCLGTMLILVKKFGKLSLKNIVIIAIVFILLSILLINYESFLQFLTLYASNNGYSTRTLQTLLSGDFMKSDGRNVLYDASIKGLLENPLLGKGIFHDRQYLLQNAILSDRRRANGISTGVYSHNIFFEWLLQYGIFGGIFLIFIFSSILILNFKICSKDNTKYLMLVVLLSKGFFHLLVSSSYISNEEFYLLIGFMISNLRKKDY